MKKNFISIFILIIGINAFASGSIETMILRHPLVKSFDYDGSNNRGGSFKLQLKNGHEIYFQGVKSDLTFNTWSAIRYVNDITFSTVRYEFAGKSGDYGCLFLKDFCKATDTNYTDVYSILDNYNDFCKLLNSIPWRQDKSAEKLCAKYSDKRYSNLYRCTADKINKFIEIPDELDYVNYGRETFKVDFTEEGQLYFGFEDYNF